jgi:hypothetical protein
MYGCGTWSPTIREEYRKTVFENRVLWGIFGPKREKWWEPGENRIKRSFKFCTCQQILLG